MTTLIRFGRTFQDHREQVISNLAVLSFLTSVVALFAVVSM